MYDEVKELNREPRMRTANQVIAHIKKTDPDTAITLTAIKRMIRNGEIPVTKVESKSLVNLDDVLNIFRKGNRNV